MGEKFDQRVVDEIFVKEPRPIKEESNEFLTSEELTHPPKTAEDIEPEKDV